MNGKLLFIILGLLLTVFTTFNIPGLNIPIKEGFQGMLQRTVIPEQTVKSQNGQQYNLRTNYKVLYNPNMDSEMYQVPGTWQSQLSPRFANTSFGPNIRYNMPDNSVMAAPSNPLTFDTMIQNKENYCGSCVASAATCKEGGGGGSSVNGKEVKKDQGFQNAMNTLNYSNVQNELPVGDMSVMNQEGDVANPIVYNRYIYANQKSRLAGFGDPIRGDNVVLPSNVDYFRPSVNPSRDLRQGAMTVMGGLHNETAQQLYNLQHNSSGGYDSTFGDLTYSTTNVSGGKNRASNDINFTAFP